MSKYVTLSKLFYFVTFCLLVLLLTFLFLVLRIKQQIVIDQVGQQNQFAHFLEVERRKNTSFTIPILMYHYVEVVTDLRDTNRQSMSILPSVFEEQIKTLLKNGYTPIVLDDLTDYFEGKTELPEKPVVLSFDDGYRDFYTDVMPILKRHRVPAVLYMVSGFLDTTHNYLTTEQLLEIQKSGLVEINAHSVTHRNFQYITETEVLYELRQSKKELETLLKQPVRHFAYPYGVYTSKATVFAEQLGYQTATTTELGTKHSYKGRYLLKRVRIGGLLGQPFLEQISRTD